MRPAYQDWVKIDGAWTHQEFVKTNNNVTLSSLCEGINLSKEFKQKFVPYDLHLSLGGIRKHCWGNQYFPVCPLQDTLLQTHFVSYLCFHVCPPQENCRKTNCFQEFKNVSQRIQKRFRFWIYHPWYV